MSKNMHKLRVGWARSGNNWESEAPISYIISYPHSKKIYLGLSNISNNFVTKNQINLKFNVIRRYRNELLDNERHVVFKYALLGVNFYVKRKKNYRFFIKKFQKLNRPPKFTINLEKSLEI
jgi:hypothetical protein